MTEKKCTVKVDMQFLWVLKGTFRAMPSVYAYIVVDDTGDSPCYYRGRTTLCICKPAIRRTAQVGDFIVGLVGKRLANVLGRHREHDLLWMGRVSATASMGTYGRRFGNRPDAIYRISKNGKSVKQFANQWHDRTHITQDLSGQKCLFINPVLRFSRSRVAGKKFLMGRALNQGHVRKTVTSSQISTVISKYKPMSDAALRKPSFFLGTPYMATMRRVFGRRRGTARPKAPHMADKARGRRRRLPALMGGSGRKIDTPLPLQQGQLHAANDSSQDSQVPQPQPQQQQQQNQAPAQIHPVGQPANGLVNSGQARSGSSRSRSRTRSRSRSNSGQAGNESNGYDFGNFDDLGAFADQDNVLGLGDLDLPDDADIPGPSGVGRRRDSADIDEPQEEQDPGEDSANVAGPSRPITGKRAHARNIGMRRAQPRRSKRTKRTDAWGNPIPQGVHRRKALDDQIGSTPKPSQRSQRGTQTQRSERPHDTRRTEKRGETTASRAEARKAHVNDTNGSNTKRPTASTKTRSGRKVKPTEAKQDYDEDRKKQDRDRKRKGK